MAQDSDNVVVGQYGEVWVGVLGSTAPVDVTTAMGTVDVDWKEVGFISEDGVTFSPELETFDVRAWQSSGRPIRRGVASRNESVSFVMQEWNEVSFALAMGGGTFAEIGTSNVFRFTPESAATEDERAMVIHWEDGGFAYRLIISKGAITDLAEFNLRRDEAAGLAVTFGIVNDGTTDPWTLITDNTAFDPAA
jgi:hypothetical protein